MGQGRGHRGSTWRGEFGGKDRRGQRPASIFFVSVSSKSVGLSKVRGAPLLETLGNTRGKMDSYAGKANRIRTVELL